MSFDIVQKSFDRNNLIRESWEGTYYKRLVFFHMYIEEKYKNDLFTIPLLSVNLFIFRYQKEYHLEFKIKNDSFSLAKLMNKNFFYLYSKEGPEKGKKKYEEIMEKFRSSKKRFISFPLGTKIDGEESGHAYSILYDKETKEAEIFQRNPGYENYKPTNSLILMLKKFFKDTFGEDIKVAHPRSFCIDASYFVRRCSVKDPYYKDYYQGDCLLWALWYLELRLKNKHLSREKVIKKIMIEYKKTVDLGKDKGYSYKACELIIGYRHFIDNFTKQFIIQQTVSGELIKISRKRTPLFDKARRLLKTYLFLINSFIQGTFLGNKKLIKEKI